MLREAEAVGNVGDEGSQNSDLEEWSGIQDATVEQAIDEEEEYIDEDRYTTVTVESVSVTRDGLEKPGNDSEDEQDGDRAGDTNAGQGSESAGTEAKARTKPPPKKKKFRYEKKFDRKVTELKQRASRKGKPKT